MHKFIVISMLFIIVLCSNLNQSLALEGFVGFDLAEYKLEANKKFEDIKNDFLEGIVDSLFKDEFGLPSEEIPESLKTEMIVPAKVFVDINTKIKVNEQDTYTTYIKTADDTTTLQFFQNMNPEDINSRFYGQEELKDGKYTDTSTSKQWNVFFKIQCEMKYVGDEYILTLKATDVARDKAELSINPEDLVEPEHEEKKPGPITGAIQAAEGIEEGVKEFTKDPLRNT